MTRPPTTIVSWSFRLRSIFFGIAARALDGVPRQLMPAALLLGVPLAAVWLVSERLGIMEGRQLAAISFVEVLFLAMLGKRLWWAMAGPLLYLVFPGAVR